VPQGTPPLPHWTLSILYIVHYRLNLQYVII
jgi:hypothetical protein